MVLVKNPKKLDSEKTQKVETLASIGYGINKIARTIDVTPRTLQIWLYESFLGEEREEEKQPCDSLKELRNAWERGKAKWKKKKDQEFAELIERRINKL